LNLIESVFVRIEQLAVLEAAAPGAVNIVCDQQNQ
jgi:hypothetical protein